jgi:hypothetical protein
MDIDKITEISTSLADENDADILLYNGSIGRPYDSRMSEYQRIRSMSY